MSDRGLLATLTDDIKRTRTDCLIIGQGVPRIHHTDGLPVYLVVESELGIPLVMKDKRLRNLLTYPSHWPSPGRYNGRRWIFATHEHLAWNALIPCFDLALDSDQAPAYEPETITEVLM